MATDYTYQLHGPVDTIAVTAADGAALDLAYTYDAVLNVDTLTETRPAGSFLHDYDYDEAHRLIERAQSPAGLALPTSEGFAYDPAGNREDPSDPALYAYDANNRIQASPGGFTYAFDADGNIASRTDGATTEVYTYDKANRLRAWSDGTTTASYLYDPFGRRIKKTVGGTDTWYLWDGDRLLAEYDAAGARQVRYAYAGGFAPLQVAYADGQGGEDVYDVHTDHLDTPRLLTDDQQQVVWRASYEAFGTAAVDEDPDGDGTDVTFNVRFPGQYLDAESGLHSNYHRYYSPELGRYLNADPVGQFGSSLVSRTASVAPPLAPMLGDQFLSGIPGHARTLETGPFRPIDGNVYQYAALNPTSGTDPLGLWTLSVGITGSAAVGVGGAGGTFVNFGFDPNRGLFGLSFSITGSASGAAAAAAEASVGITVGATNACDVSQLLGRSNEVTVGGVGPLGFGNVFNADGEFVGGFGSIAFGSRGLGLGSVSATTTSAIIQFSDGETSIGDTGNGALWSSN